MKKIIALLLALTMVFALCACGKSATKLTYATGGTSGTYYGFSGVIANVLNEKLKDTLNLNVESTGASTTARLELTQKKVTEALDAFQAEHPAEYADGIEDFDLMPYIK